LNTAFGAGVVFNESHASIAMDIECSVGHARKADHAGIAGPIDGPKGGGGAVARASEPDLLAVGMPTDGYHVRPSLDQFLGGPSALEQQDVSAGFATVVVFEDGDGAVGRGNANGAEAAGTDVHSAARRVFDTILVVLVADTSKVFAVLGPIDGE